MRTLVVDDPKSLVAIQEAQRSPVRIEEAGGAYAYLVSDQTMQLVRRKLTEQLAENLRESAKEAAESGFTEDDMKAIFPDYAGD